MSGWKDDVVDQIAISQYLLQSKVDTAERLSMIIVDNAVEYVLKAYVEIELNGVGSGKTITRSNWDAIKQSFDKLLEFVLKLKPCSADEKKILEYHRIRNSLYHTGLPLSVKPSKIVSYVDQCKILLKDLIGFSMSESGWQAKIKQIDSEIRKKQGKTSKPLIKYVHSDPLPRFITDEPVKDINAVMLAIDCFTSTEGNEPTLEQLERILTMSRHRLNQHTISTNISHLRTRRLIDKNSYHLKPEGTQKLKDAFFIDE